MFGKIDLAFDVDSSGLGIIQSFKQDQQFVKSEQIVWIVTL